MLASYTVRLRAWNHRALRHVSVGLLCLTVTLGAATATAQTEQERAGARVAAQEGHKAFFEQRWADAIDLFTRAESLVHAPPHLLYMARASEKLGRLVTARELYMRIVKENIASNAPRAFANAQDQARQELPELERRIPHLTVKVSGAEAGEKFVVLIDGKELPAALVGLPTPLDPGEHSVSAQAQGKSAEAVKVTLEEGQRQSIDVALEHDAGARLPAEGQNEPVQTGEPSDAPAVAGETLSDPEVDTGGQHSSSGGGMRIGSYVALGVGAVGLGAGVLFTLQSSAKRKEVLEICPDPSSCPISRRSEVEDLNSSAGGLRTLATIGYIAGGVGIAAGVALFFLSSGQEQPQPTSALVIEPWLGIGSAGVTGRF
jgi:hypothetical protein